MATVKPNTFGAFMPQCTMEQQKRQLYLMLRLRALLSRRITSINCQRQARHVCRIFARQEHSTLPNILWHTPRAPRRHILDLSAKGRIVVDGLRHGCKEICPPCVSHACAIQTQRAMLSKKGEY